MTKRDSAEMAAQQRGPERRPTPRETQWGAAWGKLRRWDIVFVRTDESDRTGHPAVILSGENSLEDSKQHRFNVVVGTKKPPAATNAEHQVLLNGADGLEHLTQVDCSLVYVVRKASIIRVAGAVSFERRREIQRKVRSYLGLG